MDKYEETFSTWNKMALLYQEKFMDLRLYDESYDVICGNVKMGGSVLDLACGPGNISRYLLQRRPDLNVLGIDISANMVDLARKNIPGARFIKMDCRNFEDLGKKFDAIVGGFCLPYLSQVESAQLMLAAGRALVNGGLLYVSFVEGQPGDSGYKTGSTGDRVYFYFHALQEIGKQLADAGLSEIQVFKLKYGKPEEQEQLHTVVIARKTAAE